MRRSKYGWLSQSVTEAGDYQMRIETRPISMGVRPQRPPTPREQAQMKLAIETVLRMNTAAMFGAPITRERARAEALAKMSERERALLAEDVTPIEEGSDGAREGA